MMKSSSKHLTFARLADLAEGRLTAEELAAARGHLGGCADCSRQAEELGRVTGLMRADTTEDAPRDVLFNAIQMFRSRPPVAAETPSLLRRLVASLSFDSGARTPAFGLRSAAAAARQLLFSAGDLDVDLRLAPSGEGWAVSGQVLGECAAGRVELFAEGGGGPAASADLNDLCEFTLPTVPAGTYALRLTLGDAEIEVPGLSLQA